MPRQWRHAEGHTGAAAMARQPWTPRGQRPRTCAETTRSGTGRSRVLLRCAGKRAGRAHREAYGRTTMSQWRGKSDCRVVPKKLPNKAVGAKPAAAEAVEGRRQAKGNAVQQRMSRRSSRTYDVRTALDGIRQTAKGNRNARFDTLMHHVYAVERLEGAYYALKRAAAPGVDGQTWEQYGQDLQGNLLDLSDRLARGGYQAQPVKRVYIDKADGSKRPLGVPALEDKQLLDLLQALAGDNQPQT